MRDPVQFIILGDNTSEDVQGLSSIGPLTVNGKLIYSNGTPVRVKGFTAFRLLNHFEAGIDIRPFLSQYEGYNAARIFTYVEWGDKGWGFPSKEATLEFCDFMRDRGKAVFLTLCTDANPARTPQIKELVNFLKAHNPSNLILQAVNEPYVDYDGQLYGKTDPNEFKNLLLGSGFIYSSGVYANNHKFYGNLWTDHSSRGNGWQAKGGHNLLEAFNGGGPNNPTEPRLPYPGLEDEPIRPDQCNYDVTGMYAYAASCGLFGAGAFFHSESGKYADLLTPRENDCKVAFLAGLNAFPVDACNGPYRRIVEASQSKEARTYVVGNYSIRILQEGNQHPEEGWKPLDGFGVCWSR